jgi:transcriptional regulator of aromatic amino acid metabolism
MPRKPSASRSLLKLLDAAAAPVYLLDGQRRIVYGNAAFGQWLGRLPDDLVGVRCDYHSSATVTGSIEQAAALCPPPSAFSGEQSAGSVAAIAADGRTDQRAARFLALPLAAAELGVLVVVGSDPGPPAPPQPASHLASEQLHALLQQLRGQLGRRYHIGQLIGESDAMRRVREQVRLATQTQTRVLVVGPFGSGCEHVAKSIHYSRQLGALVPVDCSLVDAEEMQGTLTSLLRRQAESPADKPPVALLLDVDRLRADAQQELAGFLALPKIELRTLATARSSLQRLAARRHFRSDLAYALSTLTIALPPLARRPEDIPLLTQHFLEEFNADGKRQLAGFAPAALDELATYDWPQNVAELAEVAREACERAAGREVQAADLPERIRLAAGTLSHPPRDEQPIDLDQFLADIEKELIERALKLARNNKTRAAELLGVNRARLLRKLVQLGLAPPPAEEEPVVFEPVPEEGPPAP